MNESLLLCLAILFGQNSVEDFNSNMITVGHDPQGFFHVSGTALVINLHLVIAKEVVF